MKILSYILIALLAGISWWLVVYYWSIHDNNLIKDFYATENAVYVSPHGLRKQMDKKDQSFILVDLRSQQEYEEDHIRWAVSIPAYKDPDTSAYDDKERILAWFQELKALYPQRDIIVYCYSGPCMTGRKIGHFLAQNNIYVKHLGIGWNERKYDWNGRNHEHERTQTDPAAYRASGDSVLPSTGSSCPIDNEFGC